MALTLQEMGVPARSWQGWQVPLRTNSSHGAARIVGIETEGLIRKFGEGLHAVIAGFQGISPGGPDHHPRPRRLGHLAPSPSPRRSRPSAATSTPTSTASTPPTRGSPARRASSSKVAYEEMLELASLGAKVLQTRSVELAMRYKVRLQVLSSFDDVPGTIVCDEEEIMESRVVSGVAHSRDEAKVTVHRRARPPGHRRGALRPAGRGRASTST